MSSHLFPVTPEETRRIARKVVADARRNVLAQERAFMDGAPNYKELAAARETLHQARLAAEAAGVMS